MCEFISFFIHDNAANIRSKKKRYLFGDLRSHSGSMKLNGIKYGDLDVWRECEWTSDKESDLSVRAKDADTSKSLRAVVLGDFASRDELLKFGLKNAPAGLQTLYLSCATIPAGTVFPAGLQTLNLSGATIPAGTVVPAGLQTLYLFHATIPASVKIPTDCKVYR